jgi:hypothetical protein
MWAKEQKGKDVTGLVPLNRHQMTTKPSCVLPVYVYKVPKTEEGSKVTA